MNKWNRMGLIGSISLIGCSLFESESISRSVSSSEKAVGGLASVAVTGKQAFSLPVMGLTDYQQTQFFTGNSLFKKNWVIAPASTTARDGLGPTFNAKSCSACHQNDGRATPPEVSNGTKALISPLLRLSIPGKNKRGGPKADPHYGTQLNILANPGVEPEAISTLTWSEKSGQFPDGTYYSLREPTYTIKEWEYGAPDKNIMVSPRIGQQMAGLGLLEAIPTKAILNREDIHDQNGDGISGKANQVWDNINQETTLGRFGWKANQPSLEQQTADAFLGDIGITSRLNPIENCPPSQKDCLAAYNGNSLEEDYELDDKGLKHVIFYIRTLAIPRARIENEALFIEGQDLFNQIGCAQCHTPSYTTGKVAGIPQLSEQTIYPYTDLLVHDMGPQLADHRPDFLADGQEWRTPPLWGISQIEFVNGHMNLMHDGRARGVEEAILWHGGEGQKSRSAYKNLTESDRKKVLKFINSI